MTTTVRQPSPNTPSRSTITINPYSPDRVSQTAFGASLSTTTKPNTTPTHSLQQQLVQWLHAAAFSPSPSTFLNAIQHNFFATWPGLTPDIVRRYLPPSDATVKGHLNQQRQRKRKHPSPDEQPIPSSGTHSHTIYAAILDPSAPTGRTYSNLTGRFPVQSNRGANYILVVYKYNSNAIIVRPLRNRTAPEIKCIFQSVVHYLNAQGLRSRLHTLDNEASAILHDYLRSEEVEYQLVPPHIHRQNASERAIRTVKNHFIAGLASTDPNFPLSNWCRLLPQAELTLNLLRASRLNPKLSAYAQLKGTFDFTRTPLAPPGTRVIIHEKPTTRQTWAPHGTDGWYLGPALRHYQCYRVWVPRTHAERIVDTISFFPKAVPLPELTHKDAAIQATHELTHALQQPRFRGPLAQFHDDHLTSLRELSKIFHTIALGVETIALGVDTTIKKHLPPAPHPTPAPPPDAPTTPTSPQHITNFHIIYAHAHHIHTTPPPSPTAKPASLWNTKTSSQTPPHMPHGCAPPQMNLVASHKANNLPMPVLSAATAPKKLNLTTHASPLAATSSITLAI